MGKKVEYKGKEYDSLRDLAESFGVNVNTIHSRLRLGKTLDEAISLGEDVRIVNIFGKRYKGVTEVASTFGISVSSLRHSISIGTPLEEAVLQHLNGIISLNGTEYSSIYHLCETLGVSTNLVYDRLRYGWSLNDAVTRPVDERNYGGRLDITYREVVYASKEALCRSFGVDYGLIRRLAAVINKEWLESFDIVLSFIESIPVGRPSLVAKIPYVIYNGVWLNTKEDFIMHCGLPKSSISKVDSKSPLVWMMTEQQKTITAFKRVDTGEMLTRIASEKVFKSNYATLIKKGIIVKVDIPLYPTCTFNPIGYCQNSLQDFKKYLSSRVSNLETKTGRSNGRFI